MKRTNLVLDEQLLETATQCVQVQQLSQFMGKGIWEGDLSKMREDAQKVLKPRRAPSVQKRS